MFAQPIGPSVRAQVEIVAAMLETKLPAVADMQRQAREHENRSPFADSPEADWRTSVEHNPLERLSREVKGCTDVVVIFPNPAATTFIPRLDRGTRRMASQ
jgi:transposase-like protein